jgi:hypothetical protein
MGIQIASADAQLPQSLPPWLEAFERVKIKPAGEYQWPSRGRCVLLYVVDGVLDLRHGPPGLRRSLPGELVLIRGFDTLRVGNGSHVEELEMYLIAFADENPGSKRIVSRYFSDDSKSGVLRLLASKQGEAGSLAHGAAPRLSLTSLGRGDTVVCEMASSGPGWACAIAGCVSINNAVLDPGDCALISEAEELRVSARDRGQLLLIEQQQG